MRKLIALLFCLIALGARGATYNSNGTASDVQAKIDLAMTGDTVTIPAGTFHWTGTISISGKGIRLQGQGSGGLVGYAENLVGIGTGNKTFNTQTGLSLSNGQGISAYWVADKRSFMTGTVSSYNSADGTLVINVTSSGNAPTSCGQAVPTSLKGWVLATAASTTIISDGLNYYDQVTFQITESTAGIVEVSGIYFDEGTSSLGDLCHVLPLANGRPVIIHHCRFSLEGKMIRSIGYRTNRGVVHHCSFDTGFFSGGSCGQNFKNGQAIMFDPESLTTSWTTPATMGTADTSGENNSYVEDCFFAGYPNQCMDWSGQCRSVVRYCTFYNAATATHGWESSPSGLRHFEVYKCTWVHSQNELGIWVYPHPWWFYIRGGTGIICSNIIPCVKGSQWGNTRAEFLFQPQALTRPTQYATCPTVYPYYHQIGQGHNGSVQITDPFYIWGNTIPAGSSTNITTGVSDFDSTGLCGQVQTNDCCAYGNSRPHEPASKYVQSGRDYFFNAGAKVGWAPYTYPHPLAGGTNVIDTTPPAIDLQPTSLVRDEGTNAQFVVVAHGAFPLTYFWRKNGTFISGQTNSSYTISVCAEADEGTYSCIVSNQYGTATSSGATLTVNPVSNVPAEVTVDPVSITRTVGETASFTVTATGDPTLAYQWQTNGVNVIGQTASSYSIAAVTIGMNGWTIRCVVSNPFGTDISANATLTVNAAPVTAMRYVDFTSGNDNNTGAIGSPWKRCPGMVGWTGNASLAVGDTVYFARDGVWTLSTNLSGPGLDLKRGVHYIGDEYDPRSAGAGRAELKATNRLETGVVRFWEDHPTTVTWLEGFVVNANSNRCNGIDINHAYWVGGGLTGAAKRIEDCEVKYVAANGSENDYKYGIIASDNSDGVPGIDPPEAFSPVLNVEVINTSVHDVGRDGICAYPGDHGRVGNFTARGCTVYNTGQDPSYAQGHGLLAKGRVEGFNFIYCYVHDVDGGAVFLNGPEFGTPTPGPTNGLVAYCLLQCTNNNGVIRVYGPSAKQADFVGNIVLPNEATGGFSCAGDTGNLNLGIYNNTFYNAFVELGNPTGTSSIRFKNNIIYEIDDVPYTDAGPDISAHSNNLFFRLGGGTTLVSSGGSTYTAGTLATFESTALSSDPQFSATNSLPTGFTGSYGTDLRPNTTGLSLAVGSPARDTGVNLGLGFEKSIDFSSPRSILGVTGWDMGAYEMSPITTPEVNSPQRNNFGRQVNIIIIVNP